jgi:hypothetical protein
VKTLVSALSLALGIAALFTWPAAAADPATINVWVRPLNLANPDDKALKEGKTYNFAFAAHDDNMTSRGHFVSFPVMVGFGAKPAIEATRLK